jgi:hypothetical protein
LDAGVRVFLSSANIIGGTSATATNVISANDFMGIDIFSFGEETGNVIQGNLIGTDATGTVGLGNASGILINNVPGNIIGGQAASARNVISRNRFSGVTIVGILSTENHVFGNLIGTDVSGTAPLGNTPFGVRIGENDGPRRNIVGGRGHDKGNVIAYNAAGGVRIGRGVGNAVLANAIFSNGGLAIDLGEPGVEPNDPLDRDNGANRLQNYPVLISAVSNPNRTMIKGTLNSRPDTTFWFEFYASRACSPFGHGEGEALLGQVAVTTDDEGNARFKVTSVEVVPSGHVITATATDPHGNTSEFSACVQVGPSTEDDAWAR